MKKFVVDADVFYRQSTHHAVHLPLNVRSMGWDWASFISFVLCNPNSQIGQSFDTVEEAFTALGNGDARHLPKYLHVIAIADEPRVVALRAKFMNTTSTASKPWRRSKRRTATYHTTATGRNTE